jgi:hypothetical protein
MPTKKLKGKQYACGQDQCQRARKADNQKRWKKTNKVKVRAAKATERQGQNGTYDKVSLSAGGDSIRDQDTERQGVGTKSQESDGGDSILAQDPVIIGLIDALRPRGEGDSIGSLFKGLKNRGQTIQRGLHVKVRPG